jgi:hypothetical protein
MRVPSGRRFLALTILLAAIGCREKPAPPPSTGARKIVEAFYEALIRDDGASAYAALHPRSRAQWPPDAFARSGQHYIRALGFVPKTVRIRSCEERGREAIAHVFLVGQADAREKRFRDAVTLEQTADGWGVILPPGFGAMH